MPNPSPPSAHDSAIALFLGFVDASVFTQFFRAALSASPGGKLAVIAQAANVPEDFRSAPGLHALHLLPTDSGIPAYLEAAGNKAFATAILPCHRDLAEHFGFIADLAVRLAHDRVVLVAADLSREVVQLAGTDPEARAARLAERMRALVEREVTEVHTSYICIHPYFGYVCRPNSLIDFGLTLPKHFRHSVEIQTDQFGFRNTHFPGQKPGDEFWIGLFGGSSAFSIASSSNAKTIAGFLENKLQTVIQGKRIRVLNFALPGGKQPQQLYVYIHFAQFIDGIITFDGINELILPPFFADKIPGYFPYYAYYPTLYTRAAFDHQQSLSWLLTCLDEEYAGISASPRILARSAMHSIRRGIRARLEREVKSSNQEFVSMFPLDQIPLKAEYLEECGRQWATTIGTMQAIAASRKTRTLFTVQPAPDEGKPLTKTEKRFLEDRQAIRKEAIPNALEVLRNHVKNLAREGIPAEDLSHVFTSVPDEIYTDDIHFEDKGCEIVADRMVSLIIEHWGPF